MKKRSHSLFALKANAVLEQVFRELDWDSRGININGRHLSNLRFADDIAVIAKSKNELQQMIDELNEASLRCGLKIN
uniref:Reverse transcriptase domain-containing protein n=1 Tax=Steinernema glaseri TaxID=37863 RepID=A0A1I7YUV7_9BILA